MRRFAFVAIVLISGCSKAGSAGGGPAGTERAACRPQPATQGKEQPECDPGLLCLSNLCVRPPGADCKDVAETLASFELGNYAEPEERAPAVAKYKAACDKARVSKEEGACIEKATDKWSATQCVPRMFPEMASTKTGDCKAVAEKIRAITAAQAQGLDNPQMKQWFETTMRIMQESCEQDAWPDALKTCIIKSQTGSGDAMQACNVQMPAALTTKMQERLQAAMRAQMQ